MTENQHRVLEVIREIQQEKQNDRRHPDHVLFIGDLPHRRIGMSLYEFKDHAQELQKMGFVKMGGTIRDEYVREIIPDEVYSEKVYYSKL